MLSETGVNLQEPLLGNVLSGGSLSLSEAGCIDLLVTWRIHTGSCIFLSIIVSGQEYKGPEIKLPCDIQAADIYEYITEVRPDEAEPSLALFVVTQDNCLHRISVGHPGINNGRSFPPPPESDAEYRFTKVSSSSSVISFTAVNAFTGLVAFSCGSIVYATVHPSIQSDLSQREFDLNPARSTGMLRSFVFRNSNERPTPLSVALLPVTIVSDMDQLEHEINVAAVFCHDGALRLWNVADTTPFATYKICQNAVKGRIHISELGRNVFTVMVHATVETLARFYECQIDMNPSEPVFAFLNSIPAPQMPLIDFRVSYSVLWAIWMTSSGYMIQNCNLRSGGSAQALCWNQVLNRDALIEQTGTVSVEYAQFAQSTIEVRSIFDHIVFKQSNFDLAVIRYVLSDLYKQPASDLSTFDEIHAATFSYVENSVNQSLKKSGASFNLDDELTSSLRLWSSLVDDCRIVQSRFNLPVAISLPSGNPDIVQQSRVICVKAQGFSELRSSDLSEEFLSCATSVKVDMKEVYDFMAVCNKFISNIENPTEYLCIVDGVTAQQDGIPLSILDYIISSSVKPEDALRSLNVYIRNMFTPFVPNLATIVGKCLDFLAPKGCPSVEDNAASPTTLTVSSAIQIIRSRYACIRNVLICLSYTNVTGIFNVPVAVVSELQSAYRIINALRWVSLQQLSTSSGSQALISLLPFQLETRTLDLLQYASYGLEFIAARIVAIGRVLLSSRQIVLLSEFCIRVQNLPMKSFEQMAVLYYRGLCELFMGRFHKAKSLFLTTLACTDEQFISQFTQVADVAEYSMHLIDLFNEYGRPDIALSLSPPEDWSFNANLRLCRYEAAHAFLTSDRIPAFVQAFCASGHHHLLSDLSWVGYHEEVYEVLERLSSKSAVDSYPNYHEILYAYLIRHQELHRAAACMWRHALKWREICPNTIETLKKECLALSTTLHTLDICSDEIAVILHKCPPNEVNTVSRQYDEDEVNITGAKTIIISKDDVKSLLLFRSAQLKLGLRDPLPTHCPAATMSLPDLIFELVTFGMFEAAVSVAPKPSLPSVFADFVERCIALDQGVSFVRFFVEHDSSNALSEAPLETRRSWLRDQAWSILKKCVKAKDVDGSLYKICAERMMRHDQRRGQPPPWIMKRFRGPFSTSKSDPSWMVRLLLRSNLPVEAAQLCLECLEVSHVDFVPTLLIGEVLKICEKMPNLGPLHDSLNSCLSSVLNSKVY
uniref:Uncharacterized protein n=1 Tax=Spongospora subterranea TaxID=70186 RepID=A0A0H5R0F7_9EUKA|eukprot:CRZ01259.1 hypothetical protein [Spongospora subterranea]